MNQNEQTVKNNFGNARIKKIKEDFNKLRYEFSKSKIKKIRKKSL